MAMVCPNCGKQLTGTERFCLGCGMQLAGAQPAQGYDQQNWQGGYNRQPAQGGYSQQNWQADYTGQPAGNGYANQLNWQEENSRPATPIEYGQQNWQNTYPQQPAQPGYAQQNWQNTYPQQPYQGSYPQQPYQGGYPPQRRRGNKKPGLNIKKLLIILGSLLAVAAVTITLVTLLGGSGGVGGDWMFDSVKGEDGDLFYAFDADYAKDGLTVSYTFENGKIEEYTLSIHAQIGTYNEKAKTVTMMNLEGEILGTYKYKIDGKTMTISSDKASIILKKK